MMLLKNCFIYGVKELCCFGNNKFDWYPHFKLNKTDLMYFVLKAYIFVHHI